MSLSSATSVLVSSLVNFQNAIQVTSNNIANANTVGYSRELAQFAENIPQTINGQQYGSGSYISTVERLRDIYLDSQIRAESTEVGYNSTMNTSMQELSAIFPDVASPGVSGSLTRLINNFYSAWSTLAANPTSNADKQAVIQDAVGLASQLRQTMQNLTTLASSLDSQVSDTVANINTLINQIASYNGQIKQNPGASNAIMDAREQDMEQLASMINVQFATANDGTVSVLFAKGNLVSGTTATDFSTMTGLPDPTLVKIGFPAGTGAADVTSFITSGKLGALLQVRDVTVQNALYAVRAVGSGLIQNTNLIYHAASDSSGVHSNFFDGLSAGDILVDPILSNSGTGAALLSSFTASSPAGDMASAMAGSQDDYAASYIQSSKSMGAGISGTAPLSSLAIPFPGTSFSASGTIHIDLSSGSSAVVNWNNSQSLTTIADNITNALAGAGTAAYDETTGKFTILSNQPVSMYDASGNFSSAARLEAIMTSATNINTNLDPTVNPITGGVALNFNPNPIALPNSLISYFEEALPKGSFTIDGGTITWTNTQSINGITGLVSGATGGQISAKFNAATQQVILTGNNLSPSAANPIVSFTLADATGNFAQLAALQKPSSVSNTYAGVLAGISQQSSVAAAQLTASQGVLSDLQGIQDTQSKVNLDQEAAQAIQYKDAYEASLRVIAVIDDMLNVLINQTAAPAASVSNSSLNG